MKKVLFILSLLLLTSFISATSFENKQEVVETEMTKKEMWINLKKWISSNFNSYEHVVDLEDEEAGIISVKWKNRVGLNSSKYIKVLASSTIKVDVKDNKYRYTLSDAQIVIEPNIGRTSEMSYNELKESINDLEFVEQFCTQYYNESAKIQMDDKFVNILKEYKEQVESTPKYKNEKKKKISKEWEKINKEYNILSEINNTYSSINEIIISSLKKNMILKDEW